MRFALVSVLLLLPIAFSDILDNAYDTVQAQDERLDQPECKENEFWMDCPSCEQTCGKEPTPCPRVCQPARCHCPAHKGFKRNSSGACVSRC